MTIVKTFIQSLLAVGLLSACGEEEPIQYTEEDAESETSSSTQQQKRRLFSYEAQVTSDVPALSLAASATTFSISLTDCVSTHSATVDETKAYLELYEFDRNCLAKLTTFTLNGKTYVPKTGADFTSWQASDTATFAVASANPVDELKVTVVSTITNPVTAAGTIHYQFSEITQGSRETLGEAVVRESASLSVNGQAAPNFAIRQVQLVGINANGNGEFRIQLECNNAVIGTGANIACDDVLLSSIAMTLAVDTYVGEPTETELQAIFTTASGGKAIDMTTEAFVAGGGTPALTKGGFITANTGDADVMVLPNTKPIISYPNMIFVLKSGPSYTYFYIDVTLITQSNGT